MRWNTRLPVAVLDIKRVTSAIHASVLAQRGVQAQVTCPSQVLQRQGLTFTCSAVVQTGTRKVKPASYPFTVTEVDGAGHVKYVAR